MDENPIDPKENPTGAGHLPVSGEVGVGPVPYHDPVTTDTNDDPDSDSTGSAPDDQVLPKDQQNDAIDEVGNKRTNPGPDPGQLGEDPTIGSAGTIV
jgi:hypothetical protein